MSLLSISNVSSCSFLLLRVGKSLFADGSIVAVGQPSQTGNVLVAAEVGGSNKMAKKWLTLVVYKFCVSDSTPGRF